MGGVLKELRVYQQVGQKRARSEKGCHKIQSVDIEWRLSLLIPILADRGGTGRGCQFRGIRRERVTLRDVTNLKIMMSCQVSHNPLIFVFGNVLLRRSTDLGSRSRLAVGLSAALSAFLLFFRAATNPDRPAANRDRPATNRDHSSRNRNRSATNRDSVI